MACRMRRKVVFFRTLVQEALRPLRLLFFQVRNALRPGRVRDERSIDIERIKPRGGRKPYFDEAETAGSGGASSRWRSANTG